MTDEMTDEERLHWMISYLIATGKSNVRISDPDFIDWVKETKKNE